MSNQDWIGLDLSPNMNPMVKFLMKMTEIENFIWKTTQRKFTDEPKKSTYDEWEEVVCFARSENKMTNQEWVEFKPKFELYSEAPDEKWLKLKTLLEKHLAFDDEWEEVVSFARSVFFQ